MHTSGFFAEGGEDPIGRNTAAFNDLSAGEWRVLVAATVRRRVRAGDVVIAGGSADRSLHFVASGTVEVLVRRGRRDRQVRVQGAGSILGEVAFFDGRPRSATVRALTDADILELGFDAFEALAARHPDLGRRVLVELGRVLAERLRDIEARGDR